MSYKRYPKEFNIEAVKQVTDLGYKISEVAEWFGVTTKSLNDFFRHIADIHAKSGCFAWPFKGLALTNTCFPMFAVDLEGYSN